MVNNDPPKTFLNKKIRLSYVHGSNAYSDNTLEVSENYTQGGWKQIMFSCLVGGYIGFKTFLLISGSQFSHQKFSKQNIFNIMSIFDQKIQNLTSSWQGVLYYHRESINT